MLVESGRELEGLFIEFDQSRNRTVLQEILQVLDRRRYVSNLVRDVEKELNVQLSN
jgi:hypothetical protein